MSKSVELLDLDRDELAADLSLNLGLETYRSRQLISWVYRKRVSDFCAMSNISRAARDLLKQRYTVYQPQVFALKKSIDGSRKYAFQLADNTLIESVYIRQPARNTLCISSQVGCAMRCGFCRTGTMGFRRNLSTAEIISQVIAVQNDIESLIVETDSDPSAMRIANVVFMGMGEPFHNFDNVARAVRLLNDDLGFNFSSRKITVSTSGHVRGIEQFGRLRLPANLAVSLNATTDAVRNQIMPINRKWPLDKLLKALREYPLLNRQRITVEYVLLSGVNDSRADCERLAKILHGIRVKVNLIPYNEITGLAYQSPAEDVILFWQDTLLKKGLNSTIRWSKGQDIAAACGQLATETGDRRRARDCCSNSLTMASSCHDKPSQVRR